MLGATGSHSSGGWTWERVTGPVQELVTAAVPQPARRTVRVVEPTGTAFVLGSTQAEPARAPVPVARRRSGGGGVLVVPGELAWVEFVVPRGDPWWDDDVGRATHPIGGWWAAALTRLGSRAVVHRGPMTASAWSSALCFAGLGPGEVLVGDRKVVGIAQRRTRAGACFQCAVALAPVGRISALAAGLTGADADRAATVLARLAGHVPHPGEDLLAALAAEAGPGGVAGARRSRTARGR